MLIYRIAHPAVLTPHGRAAGPYTATNWIDSSTDEGYEQYEVFSAVSSELHNVYRPCPQEDGMGYIKSTESSVFVSLAQAAEWFVTGNGYMRDADFRLFTYEVNAKHVKQGGMQAACNLRRARLVKVEPIPFDDTFIVCPWCYDGECDCDE